MLSPSEIEEIKALVERSHNVLAVLLYGPEAVPSAWMDEAIRQGFVAPTKPPLAVMKDLYAFGTYTAHLQDPMAAAVTSFSEFKAIMAANPLLQTKVEAAAEQIALTRAASHVRGLGNRIGATIGSSLIEADTVQATRYRGLIRDVLAARNGSKPAAARIKAEGIAQGKEEDFFDGMFRETAQQMASDLGHLTGNWSRDLLRITQTEAMTTMNEAQAERWKEDEGDPEDILVYRNVRPDACPACKSLYLDGTVPRIFRLAGLEANGTNVGRRRSDWLPVNGATHPWCSCVTVRLSRFVDVPTGWKHGRAMPKVLGSKGYIT